jgi:hypothetical protein
VRYKENRSILKVAIFTWVTYGLVNSALILTGCTKGSETGNERSDKNTNGGNANQQNQRADAPAINQQTFAGDIDRTILFLSMARESIRQGKWQEAVSQLQNARKEVESAQPRLPRLRDEVEALKSAIDRAIPMVEGRAKEAEGRIADLQTRIGAIKVNALAQ